MRKQEAAAVLGILTRDLFNIYNPALEEAVRDAVHVAIHALRPDADPATGLLPCGCEAECVAQEEWA